MLSQGYEFQRRGRGAYGGRKRQESDGTRGFDVKCSRSGSELLKIYHQGHRTTVLLDPGLGDRRMLRLRAEIFCDSTLTSLQRLRTWSLSGMLASSETRTA